ncbi:hypothetical protein Q7P35_004307 [Cladosporium inversicolor]
MIFDFAMYHEPFISVLRLIAQLNEFTLIFNVWIVSPFTTSEGRTQSSLFGSILRSIGYAISEPFYTLLLARLPVDPAFSLLMTTVLHGFQILWLWIMLDCVAKFRLRNARRRDQEYQSNYDFASEKKVDAGDLNFASTKDIDWKILYQFIFCFIQTAAASNAALLLAAQTAEVAELKSYMAHIILLGAGLFYFFLSRLAECYLARVMGLPLYFGQHRALNVVIPQVANLLLILLLRAGVRWFAGLEAFAGAWGNDAQGVEKFVGFARFFDWLGHAPRWLAPFLLVLSHCLMYLSGRFSAKARME